jgi:hypothetical protein
MVSTWRQSCPGPVGAKRSSAPKKWRITPSSRRSTFSMPTAASHRFQFSGPARQTGVATAARLEPGPAEGVSKRKIFRSRGVTLPLPSECHGAHIARSDGTTSTRCDNAARFDTLRANTGRRQAPAPDLQTGRERVRVNADTRVIRASRFQRTRLERRGEIHYRFS